MSSPERPGAVPVTEGPDVGAVWHHGNPLTEQRELARGDAIVDLSHRCVVVVDGPDRLSWLHDLTTAHVADLAPGESRLALILDPHGRAQFELHLVDDGSSTWIITEAADGASLVGYLRSMRFLLRVEVSDASGDHAVVGGLGDTPDAGGPAWVAPPEFAGTGHTPAGADRGGDPARYVPDRPGRFPAWETIVRKDMLDEMPLGTGSRAGLWAWEALRVAAGVPRIHLDTDDRTLPNEVGWLGPAVHLEKGCYRGQEAVARTHNMGQPPRRLTQLLLASGEDLPALGAPVHWDDRPAGRLGTVVTHHELGPIALALMKRRVPLDAEVQVAGDPASQVPIVVPLGR